MERITAGIAGALLIALPAAAHDTRQLGAHEHGTGSLGIAFEGGRIAMELAAPGADIVGFEHAAASAEDRAAVEAAVATLARPLELFAMPEAAGCTVVSATVDLVGAGDHGHGHGEHGHGEHGHDDDDAAQDHGHDHDDAAEDGHAHGDDVHSEFRARYALDCADPAAIDRIRFAYFDAFPNAEKLEVQLVDDAGSRAAEVTRDAPALEVGGRS